ncbi:MAG: DEAD/DEAH box helicase family protein [Candidatus Gracilibacteria bacterium]|nr:DEAD/DEAH box helicase family protein [Candidatus Gracilibacteria bacterium]
MRDKLSCNIDLATGTGKSFVIYGVAQIMLCEGKIDKVLFLCPSNTIQDGLTKKFKDLASRKDLKELLPSDSNYKNPRIIQAVQTIESGDICIENIHSTYKNTKSAIGDSILGVGERVLVLNDESHHIYSKPNAENKNLKKWHEFLEDKDFNFKYIVGFTGTAYTDDEYFRDVIYRYGVLEGIEHKFIKDVRYIKDTEVSIDTETRKQIILQIHNENKSKYYKIKPITIFISKDINNCEIDRRNLIDYLVQNDNISKEDAEKKVLIVTSSQKHTDNLEILKTVNEVSNPVEWICSVAMLTEGWDVPNVFQIVPSEERAFNSKLLISQVIGRGLRIPEEYKGEKLSVTVLNHTRFSENILHLVDEILEREDKIYSYPVVKEKDYSFPVYNLEYDRNPIVINKDEYQKKDFKKLKTEGITLFSDFIDKEIDIIFESLGGDEDTETINIHKKSINIDDLAREIKQKINAWCIELEAKGVSTDDLDDFDDETITNIINLSLKKSGNENLTPELATRIMMGFGTIKRFGNKNVRYRNDPIDIIQLNIFDVGKSGLSLSSIKNSKGYIFYDENSFKLSEEKDVESLKILDDEAGKKYFREVRNSYLFKTPFNIVFASSTPENTFIDLLVKEENNEIIDGFFKSKDRGFYDFSYTWRKGEHPKIDNFNPDFFIKSGDNILVVEIKGNESGKDYSTDFIKNKAKYFQAREHFEKLNNLLSEKGINQKYYFHFCGPSDYKTLLRVLKSGNIEFFKSKIEDAFEMSKTNDEELKSLKDNNLKGLEVFDNKKLIDLFRNKWVLLEEQSKIFLTTAEKSYFDNKENNLFSYPGLELIKTFEFELKNKIFDKIREDEDVSLQIIEEEQSKSQSKKQVIDYFNLANNFLDLGNMEMLLKFNNSLKNYIKNNFAISSFLLNTNSYNWNIVSNEEYEKITDDFYNDLPNVIALLRLKYRNENTHGEKIMNIEEFEELRDLLLYGKGILLKLVS